jgi:MFS transporter, putative signal transducer
LRSTDANPSNDKATLATVGTLAFAQEVPGALSGVLGSSVFRSLGAPLDALALFALPQVPEALRFLLAPWVDARRAGWLGTRRGVIVAGSALALAAYLACAAIPPSVAAMVWVIALLTVAQTFKAIEGIAVDAYTIEAVGAHGRAGGGAALFIGKEAGQLFSLLGLGVIYKLAGWQVALVVAGGVLFAASLSVLARPEPARAAPTHAPSVWRFIRAARLGPMLGLVFAMNFARALFVAVFGAFLVDKGLSILEIGVVAGAANTAGSVLAAFAVVPVVRHLGVQRTMRRAIVLALFALPLLAFLAWRETLSLGVVCAVIFGLTVTTAPITITLLIARLGWTSSGQTGTDFSIQSSAYLLGFVAALAVAGPLAERLGWPGFFALQAALMLLSALAFVWLAPLIDARVAQWRARND